jgi:hypothetical protein
MLPRFNSLCDPAKLYFVLVFISILMSLFKGMPMMAALMQIVFAFFWVIVLNWICSKGYQGFSWFLVLLPFIIMILSYFRIMSGVGMSHPMMMGMGSGIDGQGITNYGGGSTSVQFAAGMSG